MIDIMSGCISSDLSLSKSLLPRRESALVYKQDWLHLLSAPSLVILVLIGCKVSTSSDMVLSSDVASGISDSSLIMTLSSNVRLESELSSFILDSGNVSITGSVLSSSFYLF